MAPYFNRVRRSWREQKIHFHCPNERTSTIRLAHSIGGGCVLEGETAHPSLVGPPGEAAGIRTLRHEAANMAIPQRGFGRCSPRIPRDTIQTADRALRKENLLKRARIQNGSVVCNKRFGAWNFLWFDDNGKRRSRKLGDLSELSREQALKKAEAVRQELRFKPQTSATKVRVLVEQYQVEKMPTRASTSWVYKLWLKNYILPHWGEQPITNLQPRPVELWLS